MHGQTLLRHRLVLALHERELIARHMRALAEMEHSGIVAMIEDNKVDDLKRAYELFRRVTAPDSG